MSESLHGRENDRLQSVLIETPNSRVLTDGGRRLELHGDLDFTSVPVLLEAIVHYHAQRPRDSDAFDVDLSGVQHSDSAGVALLVELLRASARDGHQLRLFNVPEQMRSIIRVCALEDILPLESKGNGS